MKEQNTAKVYASSFIQLAKEKNVDLASELTKLTEVINASNDLENVFFLDVFTVEEKLNVFKAISEKINLSAVVVASINYLINEKRIGLLPLIFKEVIVIDDHEKGFLRGVIEGADATISDDYKNKIVSVVKQKLGKEAQFEYKQSEKVTAGYKITVEDMQLDASLDAQLMDFKKSILGGNI